MAWAMWSLGSISASVAARYVDVGDWVFAGDTLYAETEVLGKRESASRPTAGLVTVRTLGRNQHGTVVCDFERTILVAKRGHAVEDRAGA